MDEKKIEHALKKVSTTISVKRFFYDKAVEDKDLLSAICLDKEISGLQKAHDIFEKAIKA